MKASETHIMQIRPASQPALRPAAAPLGPQRHASHGSHASGGTASFQGVLHGAIHEQSNDKVSAAARTVLAQTFFGPVLKQMRDSPFRSKLFDGGRGGEAFGSMLDQHLSEQMARSVGQKLVKSMVKGVLRRQRGAGSTNSDSSSSSSSSSSTPSDNNAQGQSKDVRIHVASGLRA